MKLNSSQPDDITWVNGHRFRLGIRIIFCTRRVMQDQMGTQRGDGVCLWGFSRLELAMVLFSRAGWSRAL